VTLARAGDHELSLARVGSSAGDVVVTINLRPAHRRLRLTGTLGPWQARVRAAARATPGADATISADSAFDLRDCGVFVPKGAVRAKTSIVLAMGDVLAITPSVAGLQPAGRPVFVGPDGLTLRRGKTLTVTMHAAAGPSEIPRVFASSADGAVTEIPSSVLVYDRGAATVAVRVDRLGTFQAFRPLQTSFRVAVAASDDVVAVGAPNETVDGHPNAGAVHVLVRDGASWTEEATIHGATPADDDRFGHAVALSGDTLVVGAPVYADPGHAFPARIRTASVFVRDADHHWTQQATLQPTASGTASGDFGISVAIDGDVVVVGSPFEQRADASYDSAAYVFDRVGGQWSVGRRLIDGPAAGPDSYTLFGSHVALSGGTLLISDSSGYASVFVRSADSWDLQQQIALPSPLGGTSVADGDISSIALDGDTAVLATTRDAIGLGGPPGAAFVFSRSGSTWSQRATLVPSNYGDQGGAIHFGESVAVHGGRILVGAPLLKAAGAFLYADSPQGPTLVSVLGANDKSPNDGLGTSVALTPSGITAVVGSPFAVVPGAAQTHAYDVP
jgi:hypothetical protein